MMASRIAAERCKRFKANSGISHVANAFFFAKAPGRFVFSWEDNGIQNAKRETMKVEMQRREEKSTRVNSDSAV
jgi:hypothetical protein